MQLTNASYWNEKPSLSVIFMISHISVHVSYTHTHITLLLHLCYTHKIMMVMSNTTSLYDSFRLNGLYTTLLVTLFEFHESNTWLNSQEANSVTLLPSHPSCYHESCKFEMDTVHVLETWCHKSKYKRM